jgi:hypothetical protein
MNKTRLDEMQAQRKNEIGNQTFLLLLYLLLFDAGLYGFGFSWVNYPANIMVILSICSAIYLVRLIKGNAYVGPFPDKERPRRKAVLIIFGAVLVAMMIVVLLQYAGFSTPNKVDDMSAPIIFITAAIAIIIVVTTSIIKMIQNKNDRE